MALETKNSVIEKIIHRAAKAHGVQIFRIANAGNHLHLAILPRSRKAFVMFIRATKIETAATLDGLSNPKDCDLAKKFSCLTSGNQSQVRTLLAN